MTGAGLRLPTLFGAVGAFTLAAQTLLFREFLVSFQGNELGIAVFFSTWLFWIAAGSTVAMLAGRRLSTDRWFLPLLAAYPLVAALQLILLVRVRSLAGVEPFELFRLGDLLWATLLANAPVSLFTGLVFQTGCVFAARRRPGGRAGAAEGGPEEDAADSADTADEVPPGSSTPLEHQGTPPVDAEGDGATPDGRRPGQLAARLYAFEALGSFVGGLAVTGLLWWLWPPLLIFALVSLLLLGVLALVALAEGARRVAGFAGVFFVGLAVALVTPVGGNAIERVQELRWETTFPAARLVEMRHTPYQQVSVAQLPGQTVLLADGKVVASTADGPDHAVTAAMLAAQRPGARRLLVIGLGSEGLVPYLLRYPYQQVDVVTVDPDYHALALRYHGPGVERAFRSQRVETTFTDPRDFVAQRSEGEAARYDVVFVNVPDPETAYLNRFYTVDFYRQARALLEPGGILATRITAGENYAGTEILQYGRSVFRSLEAVFDEVLVSPGEHAWLLAATSPGTVSLDPEVLAGRFRDLEVRDTSVPAEVFGSLIAVERVASTRALFESTGGLDEAELLNTDRRPVTLFLNLSVLAHQSGARLGRPLEAVRALGLPVFLAPLVVLLLLRLTYRSTAPVRARAAAFNGTALLATFGGVAMCLAILLLIAFQNRFGHVFLSVGLLNALFMLGLFLGGAGGARVLGKVAGFRFWPAHLVCLSVSGLCLAMPAIVELLTQAPSSTATVAYYGLFLATGTLCGLAFPAAGFFLERGIDDTGVVAGALESADHWGGALGAAVVGIVAIPVLGVASTARLLAMGILGIWILFAVEQLFGSRWLARMADRVAWTGALRRRVGRARRRRRRHSRRRAAGFWVAALVLAVAVVSNLVAGQLARPRVRMDERWLASRYRATQVAVRERPFVHYRVGRGEHVDFDLAVLLSRAVAPDVEGYGGPINLLVTVDRDGTLDEVSLAESRETPAYVYDIDDWLAQFKGWPVDRPIAVGDGSEQVDVMTGATVTSSAVAEILDQVRVAVGRDVLGRQGLEAESVGVWERFDERTLYLLAALVLGAVVFLRAGRRWRDAFLVLNLVVAGLLLNVQFSLTHVTRVLSLDLPSLHGLELLVLTVGVVLLAVGFGSLYCGYLCPFGAAQELLGRLGLVRGAGRRADRSARYVKFGLLAAMLLAYFSTRSESVLEADPLQVVWRFDYRPAMVGLLVVIGVLSLFYFRFWCRYLCPVGAFFALFNKLGVFLRWAPQKDYRRCDLGVRNQWDFDCLQCNRCIHAQAQAKSALGTEAAAEAETSWISWRSLANAEAALDGVAGAGGAASVGGPPKRFGWLRSAALLVGVAIALSLGAALVSRGVGVAGEAVAEGLGQPRDVDVDEIRRQIQEDRLSGHEALFYHRLDEVDSRQGAASEVPVR